MNFLLFFLVKIVCGVGFGGRVRERGGGGGGVERGGGGVGMR